MPLKREPQVIVSTAFSSSPNFHEGFYDLIVTRSICFLFIFANTATRKGKQLVNFDYQNVNSLFLVLSLGLTLSTVLVYTN